MNIYFCAFGKYMKVLVTGGTGFIGSHTVVQLHKAGYEPIIIDNLSNSDESVLKGLKKITGVDFPFYAADCNDRESMRQVFIEHHIHGVIHFAAFKAVGESVEKPTDYYQNNLGSLITLLKVMAEFNTQLLIFSSSCTVYGQPDVLPVDETAPKKKAESPYGKTKQVCEEILEDETLTKNFLRAITLRYFNPIGAHPSAEIGELPIGKPNNLVPFITQSAAGIIGPITVFGSDYDTIDGSCIRDYIHVVDLAEAHVASLKYLENNAEIYFNTFNIGTGRGNSVLEVIQTFEEVNNLKLNYNLGPRRAGDVEKVYADANKSSQVLGWKTALSLQDSLRDAWRWQQRLAMADSSRLKN